MGKITNDAYYTDVEVAKNIVDEIDYIIKDYNVLLEPSAGCGTFTDILISKYCKKEIISLDIEKQENANILQQDFLTYDINTTDDIFVIGNPPYTVKILNQFIKKICKISGAFGLILPISYLNQYKINTIDKYYHLTKKIDISSNSFYNGIDKYNVKTVFLLYEKKDYPRDIAPKNICNEYYKFVKHYEDYDIVIRRVGFYASYLYIKDVNIKFNKNTHYFLKISNTDLMDFMMQYYNNRYKLDDVINNTIGSKSLSKQDLKKVLNDML